jgi:hypothetical protein
MWTNLFELLDGLFRGIIYFFYNFVETAYRVIRHPTAGPLFLFRKNRNPAQRQIGGLTFLFLTFFILFSFFLERSDTRELELLSETISGLPNLEINSLWPTVAGALVGTVAVDAPIRLFLWWRLSRNRLRREIILGSIHYAIFVPVLVGLAGVIFAFRIVEIEGLIPIGQHERALMAMLAAITLVTGWLMRPAAALLGKAFPRQGRSSTGKADRRRTGLVALTGLLCAAIFAGGVAALGVESESRDQEEVQRHLRVLRIRCDMRDGILTVSAVVWNPWREPKVLELENDIRAAVGQFRRKASFETVSST